MSFSGGICPACYRRDVVELHVNRRMADVGVAWYSPTQSVTEKSEPRYSLAEADFRGLFGLHIAAVFTRIYQFEMVGFSAS